MISYIHMLNDSNKNAFNDFVKENVNNPQFYDRYVVFVNGQFQGVGDVESDLVKAMYDKFGNVGMCVGCVTLTPGEEILDSPELIHDDA